jgi:hypothetical protein
VLAAKLHYGRANGEELSVGSLFNAAMESSTKPQEADLLALPNEMFWRILEFCEFRDVCRLLEVSKSIQARCTTWPVLSISLTNYRQTISRSHIKAIVQRWGRNLRSLTVTQCDATDETLRHVALHAPRLNELYAGNFFLVGRAAMVGKVRNPKHIKLIYLLDRRQDGH